MDGEEFEVPATASNDAVELPATGCEDEVPIAADPDGNEVPTNNITFFFWLYISLSFLVLCKPYRYLFIYLFNMALVPIYT